MSQVRRARKATNLDVESFAGLLGVHFREIERWEGGRTLPHPLVETLFHLIEANPRAAVGTLDRLRKQRLGLRRRIVQEVLRLGKGPKHIVTLAELRKAVMFTRTPQGRAPVPGAEPAAITDALLELERARKIRLEGAMDLSNLSQVERKAGIRDKTRGLLAYAAPGPNAAKTM